MELYELILREPRPDYINTYPVPPLDPGADPYTVANAIAGAYFGEKTAPDGSAYTVAYFIDRQKMEVWVTYLDVFC
jgi:hypothetical protein